METTHAAQELLETLWLEQEGESPVPLSALEGSEAFNELLHLGYLSVGDGRAQLTARGMREARAAIRRHRLAERLMADVLDLGEHSFDEAGCRFEHLLYPELEDKVCTLLGHPRVCPHGKPIPPGPCCEKGLQAPGKLVAPLVDLKEGEGGRVAYLQASDRARLRELMSIGLLPGAPVRLLRRSPVYVLAVGESEFALDAHMAQAIYVRVQSAEHLETPRPKRARKHFAWRWRRRRPCGPGGAPVP